MAPRAKPLLASEVLREQATPLEPGRNSVRVLLPIVAAAFCLLGVAFQRGAGVPGLGGESALLSFATGGALLVIALLPFPYAVRAGVTLLVALSTMALGLRGAGPLAGLEMDGGQLRDAARLLAASALAAGLMFRSHYPEYERSRRVLLAAFGLAAPYLIAEVALVVDAGGPILLRFSAALNALVLLASLLSLTGAGGGVGSKALAGLVLLVLPVEIALRAWTPLGGPGSGIGTYPLTALAFVATSWPAALGLYQLLAAALAPEARRLSAIAPEPESSSPT